MVWLDLTINPRRRPQFKVNYGASAIDPTQKQVFLATLARRERITFNYQFGDLPLSNLELAAPI